MYKLSNKVCIVLFVVIAILVLDANFEVDASQAFLGAELSSKAGVYEILYEVEDQYGNKTVTKRQIVVEEKTVITDVLEQEKWNEKLIKGVYAIIITTASMTIIYQLIDLWKDIRVYRWYKNKCKEE